MLKECLSPGKKVSHLKKKFQKQKFYVSEVIKVPQNTI